ncbi:exosome complex component RRP40 isoform X2 [Cylas formicarius]|uniref:exosome complex component RRP40 isoform X2 n=1 Tax=Cylas formicarius TaxID=197179 RepID=UPI002958C1D3|nr:exosome complex component RRP40 isoform X2 [Cylas formicarius]
MKSVIKGDFYFPGEVIKDVKSKDKQTIIGPGLRRNEDDPNTLVVSLAGILHHKPPNTFWIEGNRNRYIPKRGDLVVGVVVKKSTDQLKVDIGSAETASLSMLAFEGATKKQKPDVQVGDAVYAKVLNARKEMEPELVCIDAYYKAGRLGVLSNDGFLMNISLKLVHSLLNIENPLLRILGKKFPYEVAVGVNGKVWIRANRSRDVLIVCQAFRAAEHQNDKSIVELCRQYL